ncbi:hypothetical protein [Haloarcula pelagica]|uniref:hypothetical protein n=1 Tax=Haloarcula pelagica TaxID=3033389 RepID=UPI0024C2E4EB|nr:hypothetical protein [Halomicroarcula sp. YJ-61-S]
MTDTELSQHRSEQAQDSYSGLTHGVNRRLTSPAWLARATAVVLCALSIGFVGLFTVVLETGGDLTLITRPLQMRLALVLPYLIAGCALGTTVGALLGWRYRYWSLRVRIHQTVLAILGLGFSWQLSTLGFLVV